MRTKPIITIITFALGLLGAVGCATDVGERTDTLRAVDESALTTQLLFMQPELSPFPMTAAELDERGTDRAEAVPVAIEVYDTVAVAWFAPDGEPIIGRDTIVALWSVVERAQPAAGTVREDELITVVEPGDVTIFVDLAESNTLEDEVQHPRTELPLDAVGRTIIDFWDRLGSPEELAMLSILQDAHPGCL